jgi:putative acetyltransferase
VSGLTIRSYAVADAPALALIFHRAVTVGAARQYSEAQRTAWSPAPPDSTAWEERLARQQTVVAERDGVPVGFMSLDLARGYLDLAFVLPQVMGQGVADALYAVLEARARAEGLARLTTEASALARPFFARNGWALIREQQVERRGVALHNAVMEKTLSPGETA